MRILLLAAVAFATPAFAETYELKATQIGRASCRERVYSSV